MFIKVTGYLEIQDEQHDAGPLGPLTAEAHERIVTGQEFVELSSLEDLEFEEDDR